MYQNSEINGATPIEENASEIMTDEIIENGEAEEALTVDDVAVEEQPSEEIEADTTDSDSTETEENVESEAEPASDESVEAEEDNALSSDEEEKSEEQPTEEAAADPEDTVSTEAEPEANVEGEANVEAEEESEADTDSASSKEVSEERSDEENKKRYLYYGGKDYPQGYDFGGALSFLAEQLKYDGGELSQARKNKDGSAVIDPCEDSKETCSYCGAPISGVDYYRLPDGRKRCTNCSRSLVKSKEELNRLFDDVVLNMELFFGAALEVPVSVAMVEERKLKKLIGKAVGGKPPKDALILGVAIEKKGQYTIYLENAIPRAAFIATVAHELTHIWQYTHWNRKQMKAKYGAHLLEVYEGMAKWTEIQYLYHIGEKNMAKREELFTLLRKDEYGRGFIRYVDKYPLSTVPNSFLETPFGAKDEPLD